MSEISRQPNEFGDSDPRTSRIAGDFILQGQGGHVQGHFQGEAKVSRIPEDGLTAVDAAYLVEVPGAPSAQAEMRLLYDDSTGALIKPGDPAPVRQSFLDFRQPFDDTYETPPPAEQQAAGELLRGVSEELFGVLPPAVGSGLLRGVTSVESYTDDARVHLVHTDAESPHYGKAALTMGVGKYVVTSNLGLIMAPLRSVSISEQRPDGAGHTARYLLDTEGTARRWTNMALTPIPSERI